MAAVKKVTKQQLEKEIIRCGKDCNYFIQHYVKIEHPMEGLIPFKTFDFQKDVITSLRNNRYNIVLKARQLGLSTIVAAYSAWLMLFHREKKITILAIKFDTAKDLLEKTKKALENIPKFMRDLSPIKTSNKSEIVLANGSKISAETTTPESVRGKALSLLIIDEAAFIPDLDDIWKAAYPSLSTGGSCVVLSTPGGVGNWFHKQWEEAVSRTNDFHPIKLPWYVHPERDEYWFENIKANLPERDVAQEHLCSFHGSGLTVISTSDLNRINEFEVTEPAEMAGYANSAWIWERYNPKYEYIMAVDVARGDGSDFSTFQLLNVTKMTQAVEFKAKIEVNDLVTELLYWGKSYGACLIVVEVNQLGFMALDKLKEARYPSIYWSKKGSDEYVDPLEAPYRNDTVPGLTTSSKTRPLFISKLEEFIRRKTLTIYSERMYQELLRFVWDKGKPQAINGSNDDLVMAMAIGCWVRDMAILRSGVDVEYTKASLDAMTVIRPVRSVTEQNVKGFNLDTFGIILGTPGESLAVATQRQMKKDMQDHGWILWSDNIGKK